MDSHAWFVVARLVHVAFGAFWLGAAVLIAVFLIPSVRAAGPAGGAVMQQLTQVRRMPNVILGASWVALLTGAYLYWRSSGGLQPDWLLSRAGLTFGIGGLLAIAAAAVGSAVSSPTASHMGALASRIQQRGGPPSPDEAAELQRLQARMLLAAQAISLLLVLAIAAMAIGNYI
ncbi:MAG: hypothetical protein P8Y02_02025 [Deinococcales bacterium]